jgi:hypothetical protein
VKRLYGVTIGATSVHIMEKRDPEGTPWYRALCGLIRCRENGAAIGGQRPVILFRNVPDGVSICTACQKNWRNTK